MKKNKLVKKSKTKETKSSKEAIFTLYRDIGSLLTLQQAAHRQGRQVQESDLSILLNAAIVTQKLNSQQEIIVWVGEQKKLPKNLYKIKKEISFHKKTVLPSFVECHTHSIFAGSRSEEFELRQQGKTYLEIAQAGGGIASTVRRTRKASPNELQTLAQSRVNQFVAQGVGTLEIKSGYGLNLKDELKMLKVIRALKGPKIVSTFLGAHAFPPEAISILQRDQYVKDLIQVYIPTIAKLKLADRVDIFVEQNYFSIPQAQAYLQAAKDHHLGLTVHADQLTLSGGARLGAILGAQSVDHVVQISDREISLLAKSNTTAVLLPAADLYMKMNYPPAKKLIEQGVIVALATDFNPGTSPTMDLSLVGVLARLQMGMSLPQVIGAYTVGASYALGLQEQVGSIEVGKSAHFTVLDSDWTELFYQIGHMPVEQVYLNGQAQI